ncbi:CAP domain-containing protein [Halobacteria archaeon HArc-gm2]|nr:CAP domain-containing protein [Halobacteria archaeon HArc-gm2]
MVNKTAIGILGVVVMASLGVGVLIGMQLGGGTSAPVTTSPAADGGTATTTSDQTSGDDGAATPSESTSERQTTIPARQFDEAEIANHIAKFVNQEREAQNRTQLGTGDATATRVSRMASNHSVAMANHGSAAHKVDGVSTTNRYRNHDLYERCKFKSHEGSYIDTPDEKFELVGTTYAGTHYQADGQERFNGDERAVARAIVDNWNESSTYSDRLLVGGPTRMGVGVEVTSTGKAYATVDVCA